MTTVNESEWPTLGDKRMAIMNVYVLDHVIQRCHDADDKKTELQIPPHECCFASTEAIRLEGAKHLECPGISTFFCIPLLLWLCFCHLLVKMLPLHTACHSQWNNNCCLNRCVIDSSTSNAEPEHLNCTCTVSYRNTLFTHLPTSNLVTHNLPGPLTHILLLGDVENEL